MNIRWNLLRWPLLAPKAPQPKPAAPVDDDTAFHEDLRYLADLADLVLDNTRTAQLEIDDDIYIDYVARPLYEMACRPIETPQPDWPEDVAGQLLALWRSDREIEAWIAGLDAA